MGAGGADYRGSNLEIALFPFSGGLEPIQFFKMCITRKSPLPCLHLIHGVNALRTFALLKRGHFFQRRGGGGSGQGWGRDDGGRLQGHVAIQLGKVELLPDS